MKFVVLFIAAFLVCVNTNDVAYEGNVAVLKHSNFDLFINSHKYVLVEFCKFLYLTKYKFFRIYVFICAYIYTYTLLFPKKLYLYLFDLYFVICRIVKVCNTNAWLSLNVCKEQSKPIYSRSEAKIDRLLEMLSKIKEFHDRIENIENVVIAFDCGINDLIDNKFEESFGMKGWNFGTIIS